MKKYGKGWFYESQRHSLARQGIKTGRKVNYNVQIKLIDKSKEIKDINKEIKFIEKLLINVNNRYYDAKIDEILKFDLFHLSQDMPYEGTVYVSNYEKERLNNMLLYIHKQLNKSNLHLVSESIYKKVIKEIDNLKTKIRRL